MRLPHRPSFPEGRAFAFTIMDDTDVATVENVAPVYACLAELGLRTTKTVWPVSCPEGSPNFDTSETLEDPAYLALTRELSEKGFELAFHCATMESSTRDRTLAALARFQQLTGCTPRVHANHAYNRENLYWGTARFDDPLVRWFYARTNGQPPDHYRGAEPGSPWWWGDVARDTFTYIRNLTFGELNLSQVNPSMPYRDPSRPIARWWFSASDAEDADEFVQLASRSALDRLEAEGGVAIVATHLGKRFAERGRVRHDVRRCFEDVARRNGWFVPVGRLLDWLRERRSGDGLPAREWRRMQRRWARDLIVRRAARVLRTRRWV